MKAVILKQIGDVDQLIVQDIPIPTINKDEILIKTKVASINPIEVKTRNGNRFSEPLLELEHPILGWDASGVVEKVGENVTEFKPGDAVFGIIGFPGFGKTYAEYFVAKEQHLTLKPESVSFADAAASTIAAITAYQALKYFGKLNADTKVLIHAASGGVGHYGVQFAKHFGAEVWATASEAKEDYVKALGADHFIDYKSQKFEKEAQNMDVVFDLIGGDYIDRSLKSLKEGGILISIPSATNAEVEEKAEKAGRIGVRFSLENNKKDMQAIAHLLNTGELKPHISKSFTIDQIRDAHLALEEGHVKGKIVITVA
ncbi:NADP-dependent oxidoreductase [Gelidibacter maritimus]|uniref:NADP-dependent oxidoreductase n=1 Tax=Gelidibacter maritimus TaxID=2761487 RepID=A0A7W2M5L3_9FLAO|nr:NADP-dependent oxidoreductase [Gelidibacter maritimus]MBA6153142.1 NADP-dependent oxidoreductase [Gelidibacter maritimus]